MRQVIHRQERRAAHREVIVLDQDFLDGSYGVVLVGQGEQHGLAALG